MQNDAASEPSGLNGLTSGRFIVKKAGVLFLCIVALANFSALAWHVERYSLQVPFSDEWDRTNMIVPYCAGFGASNLIFNWCGLHRSPVARYIQLRLAAATHWDLMAETRFNFLTAVLAFLAFLALFRGAVPGAGRAGFAVLAAAISLCEFSSRGYLSWIWGEKIVNYTSLMFAVVGLALLARPRFSPGRTAAAFGSGLLSLYSFSSGISFFPAAFFMLLFLEYRTRREKAIACASWVLASLLALIFFLNGLSRTRRWQWLCGIPGEMRADPFLHFNYGFIFLGSVLVPDNYPFSEQFSWLAGLAGILFFAALVIFVFRRPALRRTGAACATAGIFAALNMVLLDFFRAGWGLWHAMNNQYTTTAAFFWISVFMLAAVAAGCSWKEGNRKAARRIVVVSFVFAGLIALTSALSFRELRAQGEAVRKAAHAFVDPTDKAGVRGLFSNLPDRPERILLLKRYGLTLFRDDAILRRYVEGQ